MNVLGLIIGAVLGGIGGVTLGRWLSRARTDLKLVSIKVGRGEEELIEVPPDIVQSANEFPWRLEELSEVSTYSQVKECRQTVKDFRDKVAPKVMEARSLARRVKEAESREEKLELIRELGAYELREEMCGGLRRSELHLPAQSYADDAERLCEIHETEFQGNPALVAVFPRFQYTFSYDEVGSASLDRVRPFILALQHFDKKALGACLDYAHKTIQHEINQAEFLKTRIDKLLRADQFIIELIAANNGDRLAVMSPHASLLVKNPGSSIPPLPLLIGGIRNGQEGSSKTLEPSAYISIGPQTVNRYVLVSDPLDSSPLKGAYDSGLLKCAVVASRETGRKRKRVQSQWTSFGAGLSEVLRAEAIAQATR
ncbi:hypothetical protein SAFG77S_00722 [Streptomyces afghaniensis]|uniref:hypothetical protein n=1 Tax=Streptomyces afghaniensis TaxID=66865 RepID=UPI000FE25B4B|nr:hypothetical protein [Streptomyces afghaniensis]